MTGRRSILPRALVLTLVIAVLSGCAQEPSDISPSTAKELQSAVVTISQSASAGDLSGALTQLDTLENTLRQKTAAGAITGDRSTRIEAAIEVVRSDLEAQIAALTPTPAPDPTPTPTKGDKGGKGDNGDNGDKGKDGG